MVKCWILSATYVHACLITSQKQTCRNLLWVCSHFVVTKTHPDNPEVRLCPWQMDVPHSYARMRVRVQDSAAQDVQIIDASINNGAVNTTAASIASSTVKWNLGFGSLSRSISPGGSGLSAGVETFFSRRRLPGNSVAAVLCRQVSPISLRTGLRSLAVVSWISFTSR